MVEISVQDAALYDRQIRLWGMDAQARMQRSHVLVVGINGLANEVVKNIVLAGIGRLTLLSNDLVGEIGCQFFSRVGDSGFKLDHALPRIQALNPTVQVDIDTRFWRDLETDYYKKFQFIILCGGDQDDLIAMNDICSRLKIKFLASRLDGFYGFIFSDLGTGFQFKRQADTDGKSLDFVPWTVATEHIWTSKELTGKAERKFKRSVSSVYFLYRILWKCCECKVSLVDFDAVVKVKNDLLADMGVYEAFISKELIQDFLGMIGTEIAPSAAILGGVLAQEILKIIAGNEMPIHNYFGFDAQEPSGIIMTL